MVAVFSCIKHILYPFEDNMVSRRMKLLLTSYVFFHKSLNTSGSQISKLLSRESWISKSLRISLSATVCGALHYPVSNSKHSVGV